MATKRKPAEEVETADTKIGFLTAEGVLSHKVVSYDLSLKQSDQFDFLFEASEPHYNSKVLGKCPICDVRFHKIVREYNGFVWPVYLQHLLLSHRIPIPDKLLKLALNIKRRQEIADAAELESAEAPPEEFTEAESKKMLKFLKANLRITASMSRDFTDPNSINIALELDGEVISSTSAHIRLGREYEG